MNCTINLDWKSFAALGLSVAAIILACKADGNDASSALVHAFDACKELAIASNGNC